MRKYVVIVYNVLMNRRDVAHIYHMPALKWKVCLSRETEEKMFIGYRLPFF
jgi:hypothetical protein